MGKTYHNHELAIALQYQNQQTPKVVAKGKGLSAEQILAIAEEHGIPLQSQPELARILAEIPLGDEIPEDLFLAVAEVLALAYFLSGKEPFDPTE